MAGIVVVTFPAAGHAGRWSRLQRISSRSGHEVVVLTGPTFASR